MTTSNRNREGLARPDKPNLVKQAIASFRTDPELAESRPPRKIDWRWADMRGIDATDGHLKDAKLSNANLSHAWLGNANLVGATMRGTDLSDANLVGANLSGASLYQAVLNGADLRSATLNRASLIDADLPGCQLANADLTGANLTNADLSAVDFVGAGDLPPARGLTQNQLDLAVSDPERPPKVDGVLDAETGALLVWRGGVGRE